MNNYELHMLYETGEIRKIFNGIYYRQHFLWITVEKLETKACRETRSHMSFESAACPPTVCACLRQYQIEFNSPSIW